ncbi:4-hydroxyphenylacetate 3-hydroxylase N-terminal domain-containing protein [Frigidibacter sp. MR17.24]|uniref:4-hydroxyphenylacetate 3-hydroxylase N-terminal domain-containing protein n=1 Tax=Frigidibacter sp. MR17.24 TaxID=3127345 RepID=UPI003012EC24
MNDMTRPRAERQLRTGAEYKASLKDGRKVWLDGELLGDVFEAPHLAAGIDLLAEMFDDQFSPEHEAATTYYEPKVGKVVTRSWQAPMSPEELVERRMMIEYTARKTAGTYGRPPDLGPTIAMGLWAYLPTFRTRSSAFAECQPDFAENIERYMEYGRLNNITCAESLTGPQNDRSQPMAQAASLLRVKKATKDGVYISGAKSVGSIAAQTNELFFTNLAYEGTPPEACIWGSVPIATEGLKLVSRECLSNPGADPFDHPLNHKGEEADQLCIFDNVFVPKDRIFNLGDPQLVTMYGKTCNWAHWHILTRLMVKAQLFVGTAQVVLDILGTGKIQPVQALMADIIQYAQTLRAFVLAAEAQARPTENGVMAPDIPLLTAGRMYSIQHYPNIIHTLQELCGQGLVMRFGRKAFDSPDIGHHLADLLPGHGVTGMEKERVMNFVWDLTTSSHAGRVALFENVNAGAAPMLRMRLFSEYDRSEHVALARKLAGV